MSINCEITCVTDNHGRYWRCAGVDRAHAEFWYDLAMRAHRMPNPLYRVIAYRKELEPQSEENAA